MYTKISIIPNHFLQNVVLHNNLNFGTLLSNFVFDLLYEVQDCKLKLTVLLCLCVMLLYLTDCHVGEMFWAVQ